MSALLLVPGLIGIFGMLFVFVTAKYNDKRDSNER